MTILVFLLLVLGLLALLRLAYRRLWDHKLTMDISFSAAEAFEGDVLELREDVTNEKLLPLPMLKATFRLSRALVFEDEPEASVTDHYYRSDVFAVNIYQHITRRQRFTCSKRGFYRVADMGLVSTGMFHDDILAKKVTGDARLTVYPRLLYLGEMDIVYRQLMGEAEVRRFTNPDPFSFRGIRPYAPGDDFKSLNHRASAKSGELMVNIRAATASREVRLLLNLEPYAARTRERVLEGAIRLAASAAARFIGLGLTVGLWCNGADGPTGQPATLAAGGGQPHLRSLLGALARIDLSEEAPPFAPTLRDLAARSGQGGAEPWYLLVSPYAGEDLIQAYGALMGRGAAARWLVPVAELPGQPAALPPGAEYWEL